MRRLMTAMLVTAASWAIPASLQAAQIFHLRYVTTIDATSGPAVTVDALLTTDDGDSYGAPGYQFTSISGMRGSEAISFDPSTFNDQIYYPGDASENYVDAFGLDFIADGIIYNLSKNGSGDFAYHEFDGSTGRVVANRDISLSPTNASAVPEPHSWAMMLGGFGLVGGALRRRARACITVA
jgi:hypothetical protein